MTVGTFGSGTFGSEEFGGVNSVGPRLGELVIADDLVDQPTPTLTHGQTSTLQLYFDDSSFSQADRLLRFSETSSGGSIQTGTDDAGNPWFRERLADEAAVDTHLQRLRSGGTDIPESWVVITDVTDQSVSNRPFKRVDVEVFALATLDDYPDKAAVRDAHEVTLGWLIGEQVADALTSDAPPTLTRGQTISRTFRFDGLGAGAYQSIREFLAYPSVSTWQTDTGVPRFRERIPSIAPTDSALVEVNPSNDDAGFEAFWALITGGDDGGSPRPDERQLSLDLTVLGTLAEYPDETALREALEAEPVSTP